MHPRISQVVVLFLCVLLGRATSGEAQLPGPEPAPAEPDFTVIALPTLQLSNLDRARAVTTEEGQHTPCASPVCR